MATVARRAGVGVATLYRHFPTRDALVRGAFAQQMEACARALTEALAAPDPWQGFQQLVETVCALQREERGFPTAFVAAFRKARRNTRSPADEPSRTSRPWCGAQASGRAAGRFRPSDLAVVLLAHCGLVTALPDDGAASRRLVAYLLQSFRTDPANKPLPPPTALSLRSLPIAADSPRGQRSPNLT
ncbi:TetR/AcrR family transcriptional regulator [Streptomyces sp. MAR4 CNY-716]